MNQKKRISLSSIYAERVLTMLTEMQTDTFLIDRRDNEKFKAAVDEIIELGLDKRRGFELEYNAIFTIVYKTKL